MRFIGQILPVDGYVVRFRGSLNYHYAISLTHLYQPLIGTIPVMLYQTLLHELELETDHSPKTHHTLMSYLNLPLDEIYKARRKLEAIGLLSAFKKEKDGTTIFTYELQSPFSPRGFFQDAMLSQLLFHQIGDQKFHQLKQHFFAEKDEQPGEEVTASFHDVFETFTPELEVVEQMEPEPKTIEGNTDFSWLEHTLKQRMIPVRKVLTPENRRLLSQMQLLYGLDTYEVEKALLWALTETNELNAEEFKAACHDIFKTKNHSQSVKLTEKKTPVQPAGEELNEPQTKEEKLIRQLETMSPKELLEDLSSGHEASEQDLKLIRDVMTSQGLSAPVMNVLIHYVLLQSNMKLSKAYVEKIASHWSRAKLKTAREAMEFAKKEREKYVKKAKSRPIAPRSQKREVIPDWFKESKQKTSEAAKTDQPVIDLDKEIRELEAILSQRNRKNNHYQG